MPLLFLLLYDDPTYRDFKIKSQSSIWAIKKKQKHWIQNSYIDAT